MGFNHELLGYATVELMYQAFQGEERWHLLGIFDFLRGHSPAAFTAAQGDSPDVETVGESYNGAASYGRDLRDKYDTAVEVLAALVVADD